MGGLLQAAIALPALRRSQQALRSHTGLVAAGAVAVAGATYALYSWVVHRLMGHGVGRAASMGAVFGAGGALLLPVLAVTGAPLLASAQSFAVAAYMALVPMFLGYFLFGVGLTRVRPSTATTLTLTEPAVAAVLAVVVVGERLTAAGWTGLALLAAALAVLALAPADVVAHRPGTPEDAPAAQAPAAQAPRGEAPAAEQPIGQRTAAEAAAVTPRPGTD